MPAGYARPRSPGEPAKLALAAATRSRSSILIVIAQSNVEERHDATRDSQLELPRHSRRLSYLRGWPTRQQDE